MKTFKKISAIVLVVAMMLTMVSFTAFAAAPTVKVTLTDANGNVVESAKPGSTVYMRAYMTPGSYGAGGFSVNVPMNVTVGQLSTSCSDAGVYTRETCQEILLNWTNAFTIADANEPETTINEKGWFLTAPIKLSETQSAGELKIVEYLKVQTYSTEFADNGESVFDDITIEVVEPWDVTGYTALANVTPELGTDEADLELPTTVTVTGADNKSEVQAVESWANTDNYTGGLTATPGSCTFTATLVADPNYVGTVGTEDVVTVEVVTSAIPVTVEDAKTTNNNTDVKMGAKSGITADEMEAELDQTYPVSVVSGGYTFTADLPITWRRTDSTDVTGLPDQYMEFSGTVADASGVFAPTGTLAGKVTLVSSVHPEDLVATVGAYQYSSLQEAVTAVTSGTVEGTTILLQKDTTTETTTTINGDVTIDLNGKVYDGPITVESGTTTFTGVGRVEGNITGNGAIVVNGGDFYGTIANAVTASAGSFPAGTNVNAATGYKTVEVDNRIVVIDETLTVTDSIKVKLEEAVAGEPGVYNIVLYAKDGAKINEFVSAELTFTNASKTFSDNDMLYTITGTDEITAVRDLSEANDVDALVQKWGFAVTDKDNHNAILPADKVVLGTITFDGYGQIDLKATDGFVNTNKLTTNNEWKYTVNGSAENGDLLDLSLATISGEDAVVEEAKRNVVVKVNYVNDIKAAVEKVYNDMSVTIDGEYPGFEAKTVDLGETNTNVLDTAEFEVVAGYRYTVTVKGAGYRTARYTTIVDADDTADLVLNFWNNVKKADGLDPWAEIEEGVSGLSAKNFLAGDIAMDNIIDKYDLAAVVSYFGTYNLDATHKASYAKYDLNRDGKIDSEDIAYVLYSIGE